MSDIPSKPVDILVPENIAEQVLRDGLKPPSEKFLAEQARANKEFAESILISRYKEEERLRIEKEEREAKQRRKDEVTQRKLDESALWREKQEREHREKIERAGREAAEKKAIAATRAEDALVAQAKEISTRMLLDAVLLVPLLKKLPANRIDELSLDILTIKLKPILS